MKPFILSIASVLAAASLTGCNDVDESKRFEGPLAFEAQKNVLVEDFTGQSCTNCPKAADALHEMQQVYGASRLVAVSIHGGSLSLDQDLVGIRGLATPQGNDYVSHWGVQAFPMGLVDRQGGLLDYEKWNAAALSRFSLAPKVSLDIKEAKYDADSKSVTVKVSVEGNESVSGELNVWLTESNITAIQRMPEGNYNTSYVHNHVFRAAVSAPYGDGLSVAADEKKECEYTYTVTRSDWDTTNLSAVVFFVTAADGVTQVVDAKVEAAASVEGAR